MNGWTTFALEGQSVNAAHSILCIILYNIYARNFLLDLGDILPQVPLIYVIIYDHLVCGWSQVTTAGEDCEMLLKASSGNSDKWSFCSDYAVILMQYISAGNDACLLHVKPYEEVRRIEEILKNHAHYPSSIRTQLETFWSSDIQAKFKQGSFHVSPPSSCHGLFGRKKK